MEHRSLAIAHRAGNDLSRLRLAEQLGADLVEADVWMYQGQLEIRHLKTIGPLPVMWDTWRLTGRPHLPFTLADLLTAVGPKTELMLDLKGSAAGLPRALLGDLWQVRPDRRVTLCSRNWAMLDAFPDDPRLRVVHSIGSNRQLRAYFGRGTRRPSHGISIRSGLLSPTLVGSFKERVPLVMAWPVNTMRRMRELTAWGVDGLISDEIELLRDFIGGRHAAPQPSGLADALSGSPDRRRSAVNSPSAQRSSSTMR
jgi:glycerophosphoryl diester phosphodiesterase